MAKKEKREKGPPPFHNPFSGLKLPPPAAKPTPASKPPTPKKAPATKGAARPPQGSSTAATDDESTLFLQTIGEVEPVRAGSVRAAPPPPRTAAELRILDSEAEALLTLCELVAGDGPLDLSDTDEFVMGSRPGLDPRVVARLRAGAYSFARHVDLHGHTKADAKLALQLFVSESRRRDERCVLIVHGRGLHSPDRQPVLKEAIVGWLTRGALAHHVLAFCTARPHDGGGGAMYVLLRH